MSKSIVLLLSKITYQGKSIGNDIRIEAEAEGRFLSVDKRIQNGDTKNFNLEIGRFGTSKQILSVNVHLSVIEKDLLFNDVGSVDGAVRIDTRIIQPQKFPFTLNVKEARSISGKKWGNKEAIFKVVLEAQVSDMTHYLIDDDNAKGWVSVRFDDDKSVEPLPAYLKVKIIKTERHREYFTVLEGHYRGRHASVALRDGGASWFVSNANHESLVKASYSISSKILTLNEKKYKTVDYQSAPWKIGLYDVEIPDYPHEGGRNYLKQSKRAMTWFRIGHSGERYLHTGGRSLGCVTVIETTRWMEIYSALIKARKGDGQSAATLEVIE